MKLTLEEIEAASKYWDGVKNLQWRAAPIMISLEEGHFWFIYVEQDRGLLKLNGLIPHFAVNLSDINWELLFPIGSKPEIYINLPGNSLPLISHEYEIVKTEFYEDDWSSINIWLSEPIGE